MKALFFLVAVLPFLFMAGPAAAFESRARAVHVIDMSTGQTLLSKEADTPLPPASMSKLMTLNMLFEALKDGRVTMDTTFRVSKRAAAMGGSTMFLREGERVAVRDLIPGIIVNSGNDACVTVAEGLAGTEENFARLMNERARAIGLEHSSFVNASGWPDPGQRMSMRDLVTLAERLITEFPEYYPYFAIRKFAYKGRAPANARNRNPLLWIDGLGADGLKTGHTQESGYGLVGSARQGERRIVFAMTGLPSARARAEEGERILSWGFRQFLLKDVLAPDTPLSELDVALGAASAVPVGVSEKLRLLVPATVRDKITVRIRHKAPLIAPLRKGDVVGTLIVEVPGLEPVTRPLVALEDVPEGGLLVRLGAAARILLRRALAAAG